MLPITQPSSAQPYLRRAYQRAAAEFFCRVQRGNLHSEPGTGKTVIMLDVLNPSEPTLVVAPRLVALNVWTREHLIWEPFRHYRVSCLTGITDEERRLELALDLPEITVIHPDKLMWLLSYFGNAWPYRRVIWDESQRLQGFRSKQGTKRSHAMAEVAHTQVSHWYNLTGTPNANSYLQLWGPQWFVDGGEALGRFYSAYQDRYFMRPARGGEFTKLRLIEGAQAHIQERLRPTTFTVRAEDHMDLLKPIEVTRTFGLPMKARVAYRDMQRHLTAEFHLGQVTAANAGVKWNKLRQISAGAIYHEDRSFSVVHAERLELLESLVSELQGAPLLVVYKYKHELAALREAFPKGREIRERTAIDDWNKGRVPVLFAHPASAGHGVNLQYGGHHICFYSPISDNELYTQVLARLGPVRQKAAGFNRPVFVYHLEAEKTVDQWDREVREGRMEELGGFMKIMSQAA